MKMLFNLLGLLSIIIANGQSGDSEPENSESTMVEKAKEFLKEDKVTLKRVKNLFQLNFNPELKALMHLLLNNLLVTPCLFFGKCHEHWILTLECHKRIWVKIYKKLTKKVVTSPPR